ncbi:hypothetical protein JXL21_13970 [Candidatus Bathyarchaeota archaeon]|nr:hypothetical protein [Candidatus Bathyarchaeota archaeon]
MEGNKSTLIAVVLVVGLIIGGGVGYYGSGYFAPTGEGDGETPVQT